MITYFLIGVFVGANIGIIVMGMLISGSDDRRKM
jgi:hypothetical protein